MPLVSVVADPDPGAPAVMGFAPGRSMTRGDVAAPLVRLWQVLDQDCPTDGGAPFEDIDDLQLAADAGCLRGLGVTSGTSAGTFSPERPVTRAQTASLLARVWQLSGRDCPDDGALPFDDVAPSSSHHDAIACLGPSVSPRAPVRLTTFSPGSHVSRAQFATMVARLHNLINPPPEPAPEETVPEVEPEVEEPEPEPAESESTTSEPEAEEPEPEPEVEPDPEVGVLLPEPSRPMPPGGGSGPPANGAAGSVHSQGILTVFRLGIMPLVSVVADPDPGAPAVMGFAPGRSMTRGDVAAPLVRLWQVLDQDCPERRRPSTISISSWPPMPAACAVWA